VDIVLGHCIGALLWIHEFDSHLLALGRHTKKKVV